MSVEFMRDEESAFLVRCEFDYGQLAHFDIKGLYTEGRTVALFIAADGDSGVRSVRGRAENARLDALLEHESFGIDLEIFQAVDERNFLHCFG